MEHAGRYFLERRAGIAMGEWKEEVHWRGFPRWNALELERMKERKTVT